MINMYVIEYFVAYSTFNLHNQVIITCIWFDLLFIIFIGFLAFVYSHAAFFLGRILIDFGYKL